MDDVSLKAAYLEDWMDTIEALPGDLQRNFSLIRELDAMSQGLLREVESAAKQFTETAKECTVEERRRLLKQMTETFGRTLQHGESKVNLAVQTYDMVDKHIRRLDDDLMRFEGELMMTGPRLTNKNVNPALAVGHDINLMHKISEEQRKMTLESPPRKRRTGKDTLMSVAESQQLPPAASASGATNINNNGNGRSASVTMSASSSAREKRRRDSVGAASTSAVSVSVPFAPMLGQSSGKTGNAASASSLSRPSPTVSAAASTSAVPNSRIPRGSSMTDMRSQESLEGMPVDPNEPTYCTCSQVSYGAMIACDNEDCNIEWFHYDCVGLDEPPKGKWYCDTCREKLKK